MIYIGIGPNRGRVLEGDEETLDYVITGLGLAPADGWDKVDKKALAEYFDLESYMSDNWISYPDWAAYRAGNPGEEQGEWIA